MTPGTSSRSGATRASTVEWLPAEFERFRVAHRVNRPHDEVDRLLHVRADSVIQLAYGDHVDSRSAVIKLAVHPAMPWLRVPVRVQSLTSLQMSRGAAISLRWEPVHGARLLPTMQADLVVHSNGDGSSELVLEARYHPPFGLVGLVFDRLVGHWVAASAAKTFLDLVSRRIEAD